MRSWLLQGEDLAIELGPEFLMFQSTLIVDVFYILCFCLFVFGFLDIFRVPIMDSRFLMRKKLE